MMIGSGILKGMAVTGRNFLGSYFEKDRLTTVQYPEERDALPENSRNFPFLVYDGDDAQAGLRCVACQICEKECPPQCIYIIKSKDKKPDYIGKPQFYPAIFDIDISVCMSCQICVEVCPFEAIKMDKVYELSRRERFDALLMRKDDLAKSNATITASIRSRPPRWTRISSPRPRKRNRRRRPHRPRIPQCPNETHWRAPRCRRLWASLPVRSALPLRRKRRRASLQVPRPAARQNRFLEGMAVDATIGGMLCRLVSFFFSRSR